MYHVVSGGGGGVRRLLESHLPVPAPILGV